MKLTMGVMADYASIDAAGKLYLIGVFTSITTKGFPSTHQVLYLAMKLEVSKSEWGTQKSLVIKLIGEDKPEPFQLGPFEVDIPVNQQSAAHEFPIIVRIDNLELTKPGFYHWAVVVDGREEGTFNLLVNQS